MTTIAPLLASDALMPPPDPVPQIEVGPVRHSWYPSSVCGTRCRQFDPVAAAGTVLVALRIVSLALTAAILALTGPVVALAPRLVRRRYLARAARSLLWAIGVTIHLDDRRPFVGKTRGLMVANHTSFLDIFALAAISPAHFVAKSDVAAMPLVAGLARRLGVITIDRSALRRLPSTVEAAVEQLHRDNTVAVFPEGTTWCGREAGRFRPAFFQAAIDAGVPIIPVRLGFTAVDGSATAAASLIGDDSPIDTLRRVISGRGLTLHATVYEAQLPDADRRALAIRCEEMVLGAGADVAHLRGSRPDISHICCIERRSCGRHADPTQRSSIHDVRTVTVPYRGTGAIHRDDGRHGPRR